MSTRPLAARHGWALSQLTGSHVGVETPAPWQLTTFHCETGLSAVLVQQNSFLVCSLFRVLVKSGVFILTLPWGSHAFHIPGGERVSTWNQGMACVIGRWPLGICTGLEGHFSMRSLPWQKGC